MHEDLQASDIAVGLDIGSSKVCAIAGRMGANNRLEIVGMAREANYGVQRGQITNIEHAAKAINTVISRLEKDLGRQVRHVITNINGARLLIEKKTSNYVSRSDESQITFHDVVQLEENIKRQQVPSQHQSFLVLPRYFRVESQYDIYDPVGVPGSNLVGDYNVLSTPLDYQVNLKKALKKGSPHVSHQSFLTNSLASSLAALDEEEMKGGVALIDFGAGSINVCVWKERVLLHHLVIPFGGHTITNDIASGLAISEEHAESLKCRFGNTVPELVEQDLFVEIPPKGNRSKKLVRAITLSQIIQCRLEEMLSLVAADLTQNGFDDMLGDGVVITGGVANLKGIREMAEAVLCCNVRIGSPTEHLGNIKNDQWKAPEFATAIGLTLAHFRKLDNRFRHLEQAPTVIRYNKPEAEKPVAEEAKANPAKRFLSSLSRFFNDDLAQDY